ncbi:putative signal transducing protein [Pedobacter sp.]
MDDKIIVYRTFYNPIEANIVKARLEDAEIPCFLTDENVATIQPLYNQAIGGVKLNVFEKDMERINLILQEAEELEVPEIETERAENKITCENCGSTNVSYGIATKNKHSWWVATLSILMAVYPFKANRCYHCYKCGHEFN